MCPGAQQQSVANLAACLSYCASFAFCSLEMIISPSTVVCVKYDPPCSGSSNFNINAQWYSQTPPSTCSTSLVVDPSFSQPAVTYLSGGSDIEITATFNAIFMHSLTSTCPVSSCSLQDTSCGSPLGSSNLSIVSSTGKMEAKRTVASGYTETLCYRCIVAPTTPGENPITFTKQMTIVASALDCSNSIALNGGFSPPSAYPYNSAGSVISISSGYSQIFTHTQQSDCILTSCNLKAQGCGSSLPAQTNVVLGASPTYSLSATETN